MENMTLATLRQFASALLVDHRAREAASDEQMKSLKVKARDLGSLANELSGGNQQKVQIARWLAVDVRTLILLDPTRGVDVGARAEINKVWLDLSKRGRPFLYVSSDADELAEVCDRVVVMRRGSKAGELSGEDLTERALLRLATDG